MHGRQPLGNRSHGPREGGTGTRGLREVVERAMEGILYDPKPWVSYGIKAATVLGDQPEFDKFDLPMACPKPASPAAPLRHPVGRRMAVGHRRPTNRSLNRFRSAWLDFSIPDHDVPSLTIVAIGANRGPSRIPRELGPEWMVQEWFRRIPPHALKRIQSQLGPVDKRSLVFENPISNWK